MKLKELMEILAKHHVTEREGTAEDGLSITPEDLLRIGGDREIKSCKFYEDGREMTKEEIEYCVKYGELNGEHNYMQIELEDTIEIKED